jgi:hypothetical protein
MLEIFEFSIKEYLYNKYDIIDRVRIRFYNFADEVKQTDDMYMISILFKNYYDGDFNNIRDDIDMIKKVINLNGLVISFFYQPEELLNVKGI